MRRASAQALAARRKAAKEKRFSFTRRRFLQMAAALAAMPIVSKTAWAQKIEAAHHLANGEFANSDGTQNSKTFSDLNRWRRESPGHEAFPFPLAENDPAFLQSNKKQDTLTWIGHATVLLQTGGVNILTDPHFSERASPVSFAGPKRGTPPGLALEDLPEIHAVLISHNHYDHLDSSSIREIARRHPDAEFFCPLKLGDFIRKRGGQRVHEMDWSESVEAHGITFGCEPCHHWSSRFPWDRNETLWASWAVRAPGFRFFFIGDTGYSADFAALGEKYGGFDWAAIPIGAYAPRWFMRYAHINPQEAAQIFLDLRAQNALGTHWGVFQLTDEKMDEPPQRIAKAAEDAGIGNAFHVFQHGETRILSKA